MVNKTQLKNQFCDLTSTSTSTASRYLEASNYNLANAVDAYYDKHGNNNSKTNGKKSKSIDPKLIKIYEKYKDPSNPEQIDIDGTLNYLEDLKIDPDDPKSLFLAFLLKSPKTGVFKRDEFLNIWQHYKINSISQMKTFLNEFYEDILYNRGNYTSIEDNEGEEEILNFKKLYDFTFKFLIESENQKVLNIELAIEYWKLLLPLLIESYSVEQLDLNKSKIQERINQWFEFLKNYDSNKRKIITFDTWSMFYNFLIEILFNDPLNFKNYDEMASWPSKIDEYMEYLNDNNLI
ncbi:DCN1 [Candida pseudojiufengensis]|uniref:DCN1 n=1 Tax=Candida pseudojiufengensis TaxID=497109 RepID=UPI0022246A65|nr:DCN1 [Candida pseudojiufengensis]KAI5961587.1 DCN1 [Candida pseudojiufengensis]